MTDINVKTQKTETEKLFADLDKPSLHALSYALRHPDTWPPGFVWGYNNCSTCAMGLAHQLWNQSIPDPNLYNGTSIMAREFAMPYEKADEIFFQANKGWLINHSYDWVTPERVANKIDKYLKTVE